MLWSPKLMLASRILKGDFRKMLEIENWNSALSLLRRTIAEHPELKERANELPILYRDKRGLMVVDVVASRQRRYESYVVPKLLPQYEMKAKDLSLKALAETSPIWLPLKDQEAQTMSEVAKRILDFGERCNIADENEMANSWAKDQQAVEDMKNVFGIGPALLEYMRMLCGADSLKVDVRVIKGLRVLGLPTDLFTADGVLTLAVQLSREIPCSLVELDQCLWHIIGK